MIEIHVNVALNMQSVRNRFTANEENSIDHSDHGSFGEEEFMHTVNARAIYDVAN